MLFSRLTALTGFASVIFPILAIGDDGVMASNAAQPNEALRLFNENREKAAERQARQRFQQLRKPEPATEPATPSETQSDSACWPVSGVELSGHTLLSEVSLRAAMQPSLSDCMSAAQLNAMLAALTGAYVDAGYIASRPHLANIPEAGGALHVEMIEGFVEAIELGDPQLPISLAGAFPDMQGRPLHLPDLEQGLDQLNRLTSVDLEVEIAPGRQTGASRILINTRHPGAQGRRWRLATLYNNNGSDSSGRHNGLLQASIDSPLYLNDLLAVTYGHTLGRRSGYSKQANVFYQIPYGHWTLDTWLSDIHTRSLIGERRHEVTQALHSRGFKVDRNVWRNQHTLLNANLRLDHKRSNSTFEGRRLTESDMRLTVAEVGLGFTRLGRSQWNGYTGYAQGMSWLDADERTPRAGAVQPRFEKYVADLAQTTWFTLPTGPLQWRTQLNLQYSPDPLPDLEQLRLAGNNSVRGYRLDGQSMSSGAVLRNTWQSPHRLTDWLNLTPHLALDAGWGRHSYSLKQIQHAIGASLGSSLGWEGGQLKLDYQRGLKRRANTGLEPGFWLIELAHYF